VAAYRHAREHVGCLLWLLLVDVPHGQEAGVEHKHAHEVLHQRVEGVEFLRPEVLEVVLEAAEGLSPLGEVMPEGLEAECTEHILLLVSLVRLLVQLEGFFVVI